MSKKNILILIDLTILCVVLRYIFIGYGNIRLNGRQKTALLSVQKPHPELVNKLWEICSSLHRVLSPVKLTFLI